MKAGGHSLNLLYTPGPVLGCAVCFGEAQGPMTDGVTYAVATLLAVTVAVLTAFAVFFIYLCRRAGRRPAEIDGKLLIEGGA